MTALHLLNPARFKTRAALRAYVAGPEYAGLAEVVGTCMSPSHELDASLAEASRTAGYFLAEDLFSLAIEAAKPDEEPFALDQETGFAGEQGAWFVAFAEAHAQDGALPEQLAALRSAADGLSAWEPLRTARWGA